MLSNNTDLDPSNHLSSETMDSIPALLIDTDTSTQTNQALTNAMVFIELPLGIFEKESQESLKNIVESFGKLLAWVPLKSLRRIVVVFDESSVQFGQCVKVAKELLHDTELFEDVKLRVFPLEPVYTSSTTYLQIQKAKQLWLISPPASPPSDWEAVVEEPPNAVALSSDLTSALKRLKLDSDGCVVDTDIEYMELQEELGETTPNQPIHIVLEGKTNELPSILIQDCETEFETNESRAITQSVIFPKSTFPMNS